MAATVEKILEKRNLHNHRQQINVYIQTPLFIHIIKSLGEKSENKRVNVSRTITELLMFYCDYPAATSSHLNRQRMSELNQITSGIYNKHRNIIERKNQIIADQTQENSDLKLEIGQLRRKISNMTSFINLHGHRDSFNNWLRSTT